MSRTAERRAEYLAVLQALTRLRPGDREIVLLSVWDGLEAREIAVVLGISRVAARARVSRARRRLDRELHTDADTQSRPALSAILERTSS